MSTLYIAEYSDIVSTVRGGTAIPVDPPIAEQTVSISAGSLQSVAFNAATKFIRIHSDAICSINSNIANPTATAANGRFAANQTEFRGVTGGMKLAVITNS